MIRTVLAVFFCVGLGSTQPRFAHGFQMQKEDFLNRLQVGEQTFCLYERESPNPCPVGTIAVQIPLYRVATLSTTHLPWFEELGLTNRVVAISEPGHISREWVQEGLRKGLIRQVGMDTALNIEKLIQARPEAIFNYQPVESAPALEQARKLGIPVIPINEYLESDPLGPAEWMIFLAAFFGKEPEAQSRFDMIRDRYQRLRKDAQGHTRPRVFFNAAWQGTWYVPRNGSFMARLLEDAGGEYVFSDQKGTGSVALSFEDVLARAGAADAWILSSTVRSRIELLGQDPRYRLFDAFRKGRVYANTFRKNNDYFERALGRPDLILSDFLTILHGAEAQTEWYWQLP